MNKRAIALAAVAAGVLITSAAAAQAQTDDTEPWTQMDRMHNSEQMREWRDQMPDEAREVCDEMHAEMESHMGDMGQMMGQMHRGGGAGPMHGWGD
ncbi:MAG TPA: hypothetical protein VFZ63_02925 [Jiangellaceae bacterium]